MRVTESTATCVVITSSGDSSRVVFSHGSPTAVVDLDPSPKTDGALHLTAPYAAYSRYSKRILSEMTGGVKVPWHRVERLAAHVISGHLDYPPHKHWGSPLAWGTVTLPRANRRRVRRIIDALATMPENERPLLFYTVESGPGVSDEERNALSALGAETVYMYQAHVVKPGDHVHIAVRPSVHPRHPGEVGQPLFKAIPHRDDEGRKDTEESTLRVLETELGIKDWS